MNFLKTTLGRGHTYPACWGRKQHCREELGESSDWAGPGGSGVAMGLVGEEGGCLCCCGLKPPLWTLHPSLGPRASEPTLLPSLPSSEQQGASSWQSAWVVDTTTGKPLPFRSTFTL